MNLDINVPGRVYIRFVANATAVAAGLLGKLRASGDTRGAVEYVALPVSMDFDSGRVDEFSIADAHYSHNTSKAESLLIEVEFYQKNVLKQVQTTGSADVVILEDVIYAAEDGKLIPDGTELAAHSGSPDTAYLASPGRLFLSDPTARLTGSSLSVVTSNGDGSSVVQLDVAVLNSTEEQLWVYARANSNVTMFASESVSSIFLINTTSSNTTGAAPRNPLCVATKDDVNLTSATIMKGSEKASVIPGGSTCVKLPLPPCEPALIRDDIDGTSQHLNAAKTATPAPASSPASQRLCTGIAAMGFLLLSSVFVGY